MKKILVISLLILFPYLTQAQTPGNEITGAFTFLMPIVNTNYLFTIEHEENSIPWQISIYNDELSQIYKIPIPSIEVLDIVWASKNFFKENGEYELIGRVKSGSRTIYGLWDEDGNWVYNFEEYQPFRAQGNKMYFYKTSVVDSMVVYDYIYYTVEGGLINSGPIEIGSHITSVAYTDNELKNLSTPPHQQAGNTLLIDYQTIDKMEKLIVSSLTGKLIENRLIPGGKDKVEIDITGYAPGIYVYKIGNVDGKFIVK